MSSRGGAGKPAPRELLVNVPQLITDYFVVTPDPAAAAQRVAFGTSGHRGTSGNASFNEDHVAAISQAVADHRHTKGVNGPLFLGADTHALSTPALATAIEVLTANGVQVVVAQGLRPVPTPVVSHAILTHDQDEGGKADGIVITPSHNPPDAGGFKYNPPHGGPADESETSVIERLANQYIEQDLEGVKRQSLQRARSSGLVEERDLIGPYVNDLGSVLDMGAIKESGVRIGVDPLGGASLEYWEPIASKWGLNLTVVNRVVDPTFAFMTLDHDGKIRMDCSSPDAMASLIGLRNDFDVAFGNDPDADRHGIVTPSGGLMNPNHYLAVAVDYLFTHRPHWPAGAQVGKTLVTSSMVDRVAGALGRHVAEVPVGFKWFVNGLITGAYGFGGEESAGASFLRHDGSPWSTDKDGLIMGLLAAEMLAVAGEDPARLYAGLEDRFGAPVYARIDVQANSDQKRALKSLRPSDITSSQLAGEPITAVLTEAPANGEAIGGLKVATENGWFAARPSGTEDLYKIYAESFNGEIHLRQLQQEAQEVVAAAFAKAGA